MSANTFGIVFPPQADKSLSPIYGSFSSTQTQTLTQNEVLPFTYNSDDVAPLGVTQTGASINIQTEGVYKILTSLQCDKTTAGLGELDMFLSVNGTAVPNSATKVQINQNQEVVMSVEWFIGLKSNDAVRVVGFSPDEGLEALAVAENLLVSPVPAIPSIITTILRIG